MKASGRCPADVGTWSFTLLYGESGIVVAQFFKVVATVF